MTKQQIIDYVLDSPENTNPAILSQMIDEVGGGDIPILEPQLLYNSNNIIKGEPFYFSSSDMECDALNSYIKMPYYYKISYRFDNEGNFFELPISDIQIACTPTLEIQVSTSSSQEHGVIIGLDYHSDNDDPNNFITIDEPGEAHSFQLYIEYVPEGIYE